MVNRNRVVRSGLAMIGLAALSACSQVGSLGSVLGSVLGGGQQQQQGSQVSGIIRGVDTRNQQISLQQSNGQTVGLLFDNQTKVVYQNREYAVTNLENGDQVTARVQQTQNGSYYTDLVQVDQSVTTTGGTTNNTQLQQLQGSVRRVDANNGWFEITASSNVVLTVSMPYNPTQADLNKFRSLRNGDVVRFTGVYLNNTRVELRQFY